MTHNKTMDMDVDFDVYRDEREDSENGVPRQSSTSHRAPFGVKPLAQLNHSFSGAELAATPVAPTSSQQLGDAATTKQRSHRHRGHQESGIWSLITKDGLLAMDVQESDAASSRENTPTIPISSGRYQVVCVTTHGTGAEREIHDLRIVGTGQSGSTQVWSGRFAECLQEVALKVFKSRRNSLKELRSLLESEGNALKLGDHEHVLKSNYVGDVGCRCSKCDGLHHQQHQPCPLSAARFGVVLMELVGRQSLLQLLESQSSGGVAFVDAVEIARQVAEALAFLHAHHILHLDVKPANVILAAGFDLHCKLADFGSSLCLSSVGPDGDTSQVSLRPTVHYVAPELLCSRERPSDKSDIYSLAILFWQTLSGQTPYAGLHIHQIAYKVVNEHLRPDIALLPTTEHYNWQRDMLEVNWQPERKKRWAAAPLAEHLGVFMRAIGASMPVAR